MVKMANILNKEIGLSVIPMNQIFQTSLVLISGKFLLPSAVYDVRQKKLPTHCLRGTANQKKVSWKGGWL